MKNTICKQQIQQKHKRAYFIAMPVFYAWLNAEQTDSNPGEHKQT